MKRYEIDRDFANLLKEASGKINLQRNLAFFLEKSIRTIRLSYSSYDEETTYIKSILTPENPGLLVNVKVGNAKSSTIICKKIEDEIRQMYALDNETKDAYLKQENVFSISGNVAEKLYSYNYDKSNIYSLASSILLSDEEVEKIKQISINRLHEKTAYKNENALQFLGVLGNSKGCSNYGAVKFEKNKELCEQLCIAPIFFNDLSLDNTGYNTRANMGYDGPKNFVKSLSNIPPNDFCYDENEDRAKFKYVTFNSLRLIVEGIKNYKEDSNWATLAKNGLDTLFKNIGFKDVIVANINNPKWNELLVEIKESKLSLTNEVSQFLKNNLIKEDLPFFFEEKEVSQKEYTDSICISNENFLRNFPQVYGLSNKDLRTFFKSFENVLALSSNVGVSDILIGNKNTILELESQELIDNQYIKFILENFVDYANKYNNFSSFVKQGLKESEIIGFGMRVQLDYQNLAENKVMKKAIPKKF